MSDPSPAEEAQLKLLTADDGSIAIVLANEVLLLDRANSVIATVNLPAGAGEPCYCNGCVLFCVGQDKQTILHCFHRESATTTATTLPGNLTIVAQCDVRIVLMESNRIDFVSARPGKAVHCISFKIEFPVDDVVWAESEFYTFSARRNEAVDISNGRIEKRVKVTLPAPPRTIGSAAGHLWVTRPNQPDITIVRISDWRAFSHAVGAPIVEVISSPRSPYLVCKTTRGLVRLSCFAHSLASIEALPADALAIGVGPQFLESQSQDGEPVLALPGNNPNEPSILIGLASTGNKPWRADLGQQAAIIDGSSSTAKELRDPPSTMSSLRSTESAKGSPASHLGLPLTRPTTPLAADAAERAPLAASANQGLSWRTQFCEWQPNGPVQRLADLVPAHAQLRTWAEQHAPSELLALAYLYWRHLHQLGAVTSADLARLLGNDEQAWQFGCGHAQAFLRGAATCHAGVELTSVASRWFHDLPAANLWIVQREQTSEQPPERIEVAPSDEPLEQIAARLANTIGLSAVLLAADVSAPAVTALATLHGAWIVVASATLVRSDYPRWIIAPRVDDQSKRK